MLLPPPLLQIPRLARSVPSGADHWATGDHAVPVLSPPHGLPAASAPATVEPVRRIERIRRERPFVNGIIPGIDRKCSDKARANGLAGTRRLRIKYRRKQQDNRGEPSKNRHDRVFLKANGGQQRQKLVLIEIAWLSCAACTVAQSYVILSSLGTSSKCKKATIPLQNGTLYHGAQE